MEETTANSTPPASTPAEAPIPSPLGIAVLTISDTRAAAADRSGDLLAGLIAEAGHRLAGRLLVPDDRYRIRAAVSAWCITEGVACIVTTGGTGVTGRDGTPEALRPLLDRELEGFGELFRYLSFAEIGTSTLQSRALAGVINGRYVFALPGSPGACRLGFTQIVAPQLDPRTRPCNLADLLPRLIEPAPRG
jgi:molybdenum cofactor biosynthesis protein B